MKKVIPGFVCLFLIVSCGLQNLPPDSITIKGKPGLYVPLGSPFVGMDEKDRLEYLLSPENMKEKMKENVTKEGADEDVKIYTVSERIVRALKEELKEDLNIDPGVQTYMVHYPLIDMPLNLKRYADDAIADVKTKKEIKIPDNPGSPASPEAPLFISYNEATNTTILQATDDPNTPFVKIPFAKMAKLVKRVENGQYGLEIDYDLYLAANLQIKIPGFGFDYMSGIPTNNNGDPTSINPTKLRYYDTSADPKTDFYPQKRDVSGQLKSDLDDGENLFVYARITGHCPPGDLEPAMIFEWVKALIDTESMEDGIISTFMGYYPIKNTLSEFVGEGVTFKKVIGFMYMSGVEAQDASDIEASVTANIYAGEFKNDKPTGDLKESIKEDLDNQKLPELPSDDEFDKELYPMSIKSKEPLDLTKIFENDDMTLQYAINIKEMMYYHKDDNQDRIKFDMIVLIPMDLKISKPITDDGVKDDIKGNYVMLDFGQSFKNTLWEGDLFGRKEGEENYLKKIEYFNVGIIKTNINIVDPTKLAILAISGSNSSTMEFRDNASLKLAGNSSSESLLSPTFKLILKKDLSENFGSFRILRQKNPVFDFKLYVEAKAALEYTLDL